MKRGSLDRAPPQGSRVRIVFLLGLNLSLMSSSGLLTLRIRDGMKLEQKLESYPQSPCAITHATWDEKVTSQSVSEGIHTCFVPLAAQDV